MQNIIKPNTAMALTLIGVSNAYLWPEYKCMTLLIKLTYMASQVYELGRDNWLFFLYASFSGQNFFFSCTFEIPVQLF